MNRLLLVFYVFLLCGCRIEVKEPNLTVENPQKSKKEEEINPLMLKCPLEPVNIDTIEDLPLYEQISNISEEQIEKGFTKTIQFSSIANENGIYSFRLEDYLTNKDLQKELFLGFIKIEKTKEKTVNHLNVKYFYDNKIKYEIKLDHVRISGEQGSLTNLDEVNYMNLGQHVDRSKEVFEVELPADKIFQTPFSRVADKTGFIFEEIYKAFTHLDTLSLLDEDQKSFSIELESKFVMTMIDPKKISMTAPQSFPIISNDYLYVELKNDKSTNEQLLYPLSIYQGIETVINQDSRDDIVYYEPKISVSLEEEHAVLLIDELNPTEVLPDDKTKKAPIQWDSISIFLNGKFIQDFEKKSHLEILLDIDAFKKNEAQILFYQQSNVYKSVPIFSKKLILPQRSL